MFRSLAVLGTACISTGVEALDADVHNAEIKLLSKPFPTMFLATGASKKCYKAKAVGTTGGTGCTALCKKEATCAHVCQHNGAGAAGSVTQICTDPLRTSCLADDNCVWAQSQLSSAVTASGSACTKVAQCSASGGTSCKAEAMKYACTWVDGPGTGEDPTNGQCKQKAGEAETAAECIAKHGTPSKTNAACTAKTIGEKVNTASCGVKKCAAGECGGKKAACTEDQGCLWKDATAVSGFTPLEKEGTCEDLPKIGECVTGKICADTACTQTFKDNCLADKSCTYIETTGVAATGAKCRQRTKADYTAVCAKAIDGASDDTAKKTGCELATDVKAAANEHGKASELCDWSAEVTAATKTAAITKKCNDCWATKSTPSFAGARSAAAALIMALLSAFV